MEIWKTIPSLSDYYEASSEGQIRRAKPGKNTEVGRILSQRAKSKTRYRRCRITIGGISKDYSVHRLVCEAFHGPADEKEVDHLDNDPSNNRPENLEWVTKSENNKRIYQRGFQRVLSKETKYRMSRSARNRKESHYRRGDQVSGAILSESDARWILAAWSTYIGSIASFARFVNFKESIVRRLVLGKTWKHLSR